MGEGYQAWSRQQRVQITTGNLTLSTLGSLPVCPPPNLSNVFPVIFDNAVNRPSCCQPWGGYAGVGMGNSPQRETEHPPFVEAGQGHDISDHGGANEWRAPHSGPEQPGNRGLSSDRLPSCLETRVSSTQILGLPMLA